MAWKPSKQRYIMAHRKNLTKQYLPNSRHFNALTFQGESVFALPTSPRLGISLGTLLATGLNEDQKNHEGLPSISSPNSFKHSKSQLPALEEGTAK